MSDSQKRELIEQILMLDPISAAAEGSSRVAYDMCSVDELREFRDTLLRFMHVAGSDARRANPQDAWRQIAVATFNANTVPVGRA